MAGPEGSFQERPDEPRLPGQGQGVEDAVTVLSGQHAELRRLIREVERLPRVSLDATGPELRRLQELMAELRRCFVVHERLKERYLWPALRRAWPDGRVVSRAARDKKRQVEERFVKFRWLSERDVLASEVMDQILGPYQPGEPSPGPDAP